MAKEVKNPRKPATKKATNEKEVKEVTVQVEGEVTPTPDELVELKPEDIVSDVKFDETEKDNDREKSEDENELRPQEIIEEFTEATKKLDSIMISENPEEVLKNELEKANEVAEQLKKQIKEQETNYYNPNKTWNGVTDGWYDY
jgi:hypothetical protein